jgi:hypothetical protein
MVKGIWDEGFPGGLLIRTRDMIFETCPPQQEAWKELEFSCSVFSRKEDTGYVRSR